MGFGRKSRTSSLDSTLAWYFSAAVRNEHDEYSGQELKLRYKSSISGGLSEPNCVKIVNPLRMRRGPQPGTHCSICAITEDFLEWRLWRMKYHKWISFSWPTFLITSILGLKWRKNIFSGSYEIRSFLYFFVGSFKSCAGLRYSHGKKAFRSTVPNTLYL